MNYDEIQKLWQSKHNEPTTKEMEKQMKEFTSKLRREYRGFAIHMTLVLGSLSLMTFKIIQHLATQGPMQLPREKSIDLSSEWALIPLLALPWLAAIHFIRMHLKHRRAHPDYDQSISSSLGAMIDSTRLAIHRLRLMVILFLVGIPVCALCIRQMYHAGKMRPHELKSMIALFSAIAVVSLSCFAIGYFRNLLPRKRQLDELANAYRADGGTVE